MRTLIPKTRRFASYADVPKTYRELCQFYLPRPIHDDTEDTEATAIMNALVVFARLNAEQQDYLDVLVEFDPEHIPGLLTLAGMEIELSERLGRKVDMRTAEDLSRYFRDEVLGEALTIYEQA